MMNCCKNCNNNPANNKFASGICNCALPAMEMAGGTTNDSYSTTYSTVSESEYKINVKDERLEKLVEEIYEILRRR